MNKHTKGEWYLTDDGFTLASNDFKSAIAYIEDWDDDESKANAKLIAAAPELLEVLIKMIDDCDNYDARSMATTIKIAKAAIKKAAA